MRYQLVLLAVTDNPPVNIDFKTEKYNILSHENQTSGINTFASLGFSVYALISLRICSMVVVIAAHDFFFTLIRVDDVMHARVFVCEHG